MDVYGRVNMPFDDFTQMVRWSRLRAEISIWDNRQVLEL